MPAKVSFFPVDNGDMCLITLPSGRTLLIDINIRASADDPGDTTRDVAKDLKERLSKDAGGRYYVDVFVLSHPDQDHCAGLKKHFHLGPPSENTGDKIIIREMWSSPLIFRRKSKHHKLCDDAIAFRTEAKRRVACYRESGLEVPNGDRILILGKDNDGKTDDLTEILVEIDDLITKVNRLEDANFEARLLGPLPFSDDEDEEELIGKNNSSVVLRFKLTSNGGTCFFLTGGDAEVDIWERMWDRHHTHSDWLQYHLLLSPHHCSWHTLSHDSWSELGEKVKVSTKARKALAQALNGAYIVASSKPISNDDSDPPCTRAKREYEAILSPVSGTFECTGSYPPKKAPEPMEFEINASGLHLISARLGSTASMSSGVVVGTPLPHGN